MFIGGCIALTGIILIGVFVAILASAPQQNTTISEPSANIAAERHAALTREFETGEYSDFYKDFYRTSKFIDNITDKTVHTNHLYLVRVEPCGQANAFYRPRDRTIVMCDELAYDVARMLYPYVFESYTGGNSTPYDNELWRATYNTVRFVLNHEEGHAYIDLNNVPITGREEDVADQFAFSLQYYFDVIDQLENPKNTKRIKNEKSINAAKWFFLASKDATIDTLSFYDEHGLDAQRYYNIMCWVYGTDPRAYTYFINESYLPESRAERCVYESHQVRQGFLTVFVDASEYYSSKFLEWPET